MEAENIRKELASIEGNLKVEPDNVGLLLRHAELLRMLGFLLGNRDFASRALEDNNRAIELESDSPLPWLERGITYFTLDKQEQAIKDLSKSISIQPSDRAYYNRGVALWRKIESQDKGKKSGTKGDVYQVLEDYREAITINPKHDNAYYNRGVVHMNIGAFDKAIKDFSKTIDLRPADPVSLFNRGVCYENLSKPRYSNPNDLMMAINDYSAAIKLKPAYIQALYNRAICFEFLSAKGRYAERENVILAINDYSQILKFEPQNDLVLFNRGWAFESINQIGNALRDYERFAEISQDKEAIRQIRVHIQELKSRN